MSGNLHIFRLKSDPLQYQVNYNVGANSWVQVFTPEGLDEFLHHSSGIAGDDVDAMMAELRQARRTTQGNVDLPESHLGEMGFAESSSDE